MSRILSGIGAVTLCVAACNDKDISLIAGGDAGTGGSTPGTAGMGGSGVAGQGGSGTSGSAGLGGGGAGGNASAGSAGQGNSAGSGGESGDAGTDADVNVDSGPPPGPYAAICATSCANRIAWAAASGGGGANCPGFVTEGCQETCEAEIALFVNDAACAAYAPMMECHGSANVWYCESDVVFANNCAAGSAGGATPRGDCSTVCDTQAAAVNACFGP